MSSYLVDNSYIEIDFKLLSFKNETQEGAMYHVTSSFLVFLSFSL